MHAEVSFSPPCAMRCGGARGRFFRRSFLSLHYRLSVTVSASWQSHAGPNKAVNGRISYCNLIDPARSPMSRSAVEMRARIRDSTSSGGIRKSFLS